MNGGIRVYDDVLTSAQVNMYRTMLLSFCRFRYGERDSANAEPAGLTFDFTETRHCLPPACEKMLDNLLNILYEKNSALKDMELDRIYLNVFLKNENPSFHRDGQDEDEDDADEVVTCIFYLNPQMSLNDGGETQFLMEGEIKGILSKPGRLTIFDGNLLHRATSFANCERLTLAFKFFP